MSNHQAQHIKEIEDKYAKLNLEEEEATSVEYDEEVVEEDGIDMRWCLVGKLLVDIPVDFNAMKSTLAGLWKPGMGMFVREIEANLYLFQFYHEIDIGRVIEGSPWTFNRAQLVFERVNLGVNPREVKLHHLDMWVQIHDLQYGFRSERVVKDIGNYVGTYVKSDPNNFNGVWREFFRVRVTVDIDQPLRRKMKIKKKGGEWFWVNFKYEHAPTFCFICGIIGHSERFCPKLFQQEGEITEKMYGSWMRAVPRRHNQSLGSKWLREEPAVFRKNESMAEEGVHQPQGGGT